MNEIEWKPISRLKSWRPEESKQYFLSTERKCKHKFYTWSNILKKWKGNKNIEGKLRDYIVSKSTAKEWRNDVL